MEPKTVSRIFVELLAAVLFLSGTISHAQSASERARVEACGVELLGEQYSNGSWVWRFDPDTDRSREETAFAAHFSFFKNIEYDSISAASSVIRRTSRSSDFFAGPKMLAAAKYCPESGFSAELVLHLAIAAYAARSYADRDRLTTPILLSIPELLNGETRLVEDEVRRIGSEQLSSLTRNERFAVRDAIRGNHIFSLSNALRARLRIEALDTTGDKDKPQTETSNPRLEVPFRDRTYSLDHHQIMLLGAWNAEKQLERLKTAQGLGAAIAGARNTLGKLGGDFEQSATLKKSARSILLNTSNTTFRDSYNFGAYSAVVGQLREFEKGHDPKTEMLEKLITGLELRVPLPIAQK